MDQPLETLNEERQALLAALQCVLEPLAMLCLTKGINIQSAEALLRQSYVKVARQNCGGNNQERQTSRISAMTGLTRREVDRIESSAHPTPVTPRSPATDVLTHWISLPEYLDSNHSPLDLKRQGDPPSFESLAQGVTRDVHPRTLLDELVRLKLVKHHPKSDTVSVLQDAFVPRGNWEQMLGFLGNNVGDHLHSAVTNVLGQGNEHFEQALLADELSTDSIQLAKAMIAQQWRHLMSNLGPQLQALMDADQAAGRTQDQLLRIGMYSWSQSMPEPILKGKNPT